MNPEPNTVVRPPHFDLLLQLVTPAEQGAIERGETLTTYTFGRRAYELVWGSDVVTGETDHKGFVRKAGLDGAVERGTLRVGTRGGDQAFVEAFTLPIQQVHTGDADPARALRRQVATRLVNLGYLNALDASDESLREAIACFLHQTPERGLAPYRAVDLVAEWPMPIAASRAEVLRSVLRRLKAACGEVGT